MVGAYQISNGSRDLTIPLSGRFVIRGLVLAAINLPTKLELRNSTHYQDMKGDTKYRKWGVLGQLGVTQGH